MKKSYRRLIVFDIIMAICLLLSSFILNILRNYWYMCIFLGILLIIFKLVFGFEKDKHRYIKDTIVNMLIIFMSCFIVYYIFGIFIGFVKTDNYLNYYGISTFVLPYIIMIIFKEYLRMQMLTKGEKSKVFIVATCVIFILLDLSNVLNIASLGDSYSVFLFIALTLLPIISNNIVCTYIAMKLGCKPNIFWLMIAGLYGSVLPIVPNVGEYIESLIEVLFPFGLMYSVYSFFDKRDKNIPISYVKKRFLVEIPALAVVVFVLAYFVSGLFRYYAIAIATGSMRPQINVGDVVIVDQKIDYKKLKVGEVIAYKYDNIVIVHRLVDIAVVGDDYYFYTQGDANNTRDDYIIYPKTIIGKANKRIPYVGLPTVWLNDLFSKK